MSEDRSSSDPGDKSWIEKIAHAFSSEPKTREDLLDVLAVARQNEVIDDDATSIVEGAMHISEMVQIRCLHDSDRDGNHGVVGLRPSRSLGKWPSGCPG